MTLSSDETIIKTDINRKQVIFVIAGVIYGLDYNVNLNMIATGSNDKSIKLWDCDYGELIIDKLNAHNSKYINKVLFIIKKNQLISLDNDNIILIWNINFEGKQLE